MKNKKHFLFTKIDKETIKDTKVKRAIKLTLAFAFIFSLVMQLIGCISLSAIAWDYNYYDEPQVSNSPTVEVVDELPISPSANVIYIINTEVVDDSIVGTWLFNSTFNNLMNSNSSLRFAEGSAYGYIIRPDGTLDRLPVKIISASSAGYISVGFYDNRQTEYNTSNYYYVNSSYVGGLDYSHIQCNYPYYSTTSSLVTKTSTKGEKCRTIEILSEPTNTSYVDGFTWLKANAVKQGGGSSTVTTTYNVYINSTWQTFDNLPQAVNSLFDGSFDSFIGSLLDSNGLLHQDIINWGDDKYERGYQQGLNDDYGKEVVLGFLSAPRDILSSFVLFEVGEVQISVWSIFTTILGVTLFIWFLKVFAGG